MKVLVTGGAGFIGSHLCERLLGKGLQLICLDDFNDFYDPGVKKENIKKCLDDENFILEETDLLDDEGIESLFQEYDFDVVVHLAAYAGVQPSIRNPPLYSQVNITGTVNLLESCRKNDVNHFILGSSSSVYGINNKIPFTEDDPVTQPISPYAATKRAVEVFCFVYNHLYGINVSCLRLFTVYGPRQRPDLAIHKFTKLIDAGETIDVYGDGSSKRDYTFISDIIDGIMKAIDKKFKYEIINLGNSQPVELKYLIRLLEENMGRKAKINRLPDQPGDVPI
ncbi:NAD-dependent epimerase/dehydratase family protein, partial [Candidatus Altiarchaeota archaeon]